MRKQQYKRLIKNYAIFIIIYSVLWIPKLIESTRIVLNKNASFVFILISDIGMSLSGIVKFILYNINKQINNGNIKLFYKMAQIPGSRPNFNNIYINDLKSDASIDDFENISIHGNNIIGITKTNILTSSEMNDYHEAMYTQRLTKPSSQFQLN